MLQLSKESSNAEDETLKLANAKLFDAALYLKNDFQKNKETQIQSETKYEEELLVLQSSSNDMETELQRRHEVLQSYVMQTKILEMIALDVSSFYLTTISPTIIWSFSIAPSSAP